MRYIREISNDQFKIGLYQWNNKYIVKIESGMYEQTYKIDDYEVPEVAELEASFDERFLNTVRLRFDQMHEDFLETLKRNNVLF